MIPQVDRLLADECLLRTLEKSDIPYWYKWFNDDQVLRYSIHRSRGFTVAQQGAMYDELVEDPNKIQFMICEPKQQERIGIISFVISVPDRSADISVIIGEKDYWGGGVSTTAIREIMKYGIQHHQIKQFTAGCDVRNIGSQRAFEKNGFSVFLKLPKSIKYPDEDQLHDGIRLQKIV